MKENERSKRLIGQDTRRRDLFTPDRYHDAYKAKSKPAGPLVCPRCSAVFTAGRWRWASQAPAKAEEELCPACHRINDKFPAGEIRVSGDFAMAHREDILNLMRNCEARERQEHPLAKIMAIQESEGEIIVTTTDIHLPHVIGNALERAFKTQADFRFNVPEYFIHVTWRRENANKG
jgi:hypothetical protein